MKIYSNASLIILLGSIISVTFWGCNKTDQEFHQVKSAQQEQAKQDSTQTNTMVPDQTGNTKQESKEQSDQPNPDDASTPSEAVLTDDNDNDSFPIGTEHPMVNEDDKAKWIDVNQHYTQWLSSRDAQESTEQTKESATNTELPKPDYLKNDNINPDNDDNLITNDIVEYDESEYKFSTVSITPCAGGKAKNTGCGTEERTIFMTLTQRCSAKSGLCEYNLVDNEIVFEAGNKYNIPGDKKWIQPSSTTRPLEGKMLVYKDFFEMNKEKNYNT